MVNYLKIFIIIVLFSSCSINQNEYKEISKELLKKELLISKSSKDYDCNWMYGKNEIYHFFSFVCTKKHIQDSYLKVVKQYKIKYNKLTVKLQNEIKNSDAAWVAIYNDNILILW
ncbi:MAG: hypothetical protein C0625_01680 [Arcobacter sp.]|nr:MAG: hypothetical protein C0625_01680 [Arcobacter sp.]